MPPDPAVAASAPIRPQSIGCGRPEKLKKPAKVCHQVAGFGGGQRQPNRFEVAQLADQHDVRVFAQSRAQSVGERKGMRADFALINHRLARLVHELNRILDRQNVPVQIVVDVVDHRRQRGRLARAGRAGHQYQTARSARKIGEYAGRLQLFERQHARRNRSQHRGGAAILVECIDAEARQPRQVERKIGLQIFVVLLALRIVHDVVDHAVHVFVLERRQVDAAHVAVNADHRRQPRRQMQVRRLVFDGKCEQFRNIHGGRRWPPCVCVESASLRDLRAEA